MTIPLGLGPSGRASGLKSTGYKEVVSPLQNQNQAGLTQMLHALLGQQGGGFQKGLGDLSSLAGGDESRFQEMEAPALRQFNQLQGGLASRFSGMGSGAQKSSGFQNTMGEAGASLAEQLQSQRLGFQQNALDRLMGLSNQLLDRPTFQSGFAQKKMPFWKELLSGASSGGSSLLSLLPLLM